MAAAPTPAVAGDFFVGSEAEYQAWLLGLRTTLAAPAPKDPVRANESKKGAKTDALVERRAASHRAGIVEWAIDYSNSDISLAALNLLMSSLLPGAALGELYLSNNHIGDDGAYVIAKALDRLPQLNTIYLSGNKLADKGACVLASALQKNNSVTTLDLYMNRIGDAGATAISRMLVANVSLNILNLKGNLIGPPGQLAIARAMAQNASIQSLAIDENTGQSEKAIESITQSLEVNTDPRQKIKLHFKRLNHQRRVEDMRPHFRAFVNRTDFADLTIECANGSCVAHKVLILGRTPHLYRKWCPDPSTKSVSLPTLPRAALMCLLEHIYALEIIFLDLDAESTVTLRRFARENDLPALNISLSDSNALDSITDLTLSQEALLSQPGLSDVALVGEDNPSPIHVHRVILAARSQYFQALFTSGLKETNEALVRLKKPRILLASVVEFIYTGDVQVVDSSIAIDLLLASLEYRLPGLQTIIETMVADAVDAENVADLTALAEEQNLDLLRSACRLFQSDGPQGSAAAAPPARVNFAADPAPAAAEPRAARTAQAQPEYVPRENAQVRQTCVVQ